MVQRILRSGVGLIVVAMLFIVATAPNRWAWGSRCITCRDAISPIPKIRFCRLQRKSFPPTKCNGCPLMRRGCNWPLRIEPSVRGWSAIRRSESRWAPELASPVLTLTPLREPAPPVGDVDPAALYDSPRLVAGQPQRSDAVAPGRSGREERADAHLLTGRRAQRFHSATSVCVIRALRISTGGACHIDQAGITR